MTYWIITATSIFAGIFGANLASDHVKELRAKRAIARMLKALRNDDPQSAPVVPLHRVYDGDKD